MSTAEPAGATPVQVGSTKGLLRGTLKAWAIGFLLFSAWSVASPSWAYPDEPAHNFMAYSTGHGELWPERVTIHNGTGSSTALTTIPETWLHSVQGFACYAFHPEVSAACYSPPAPGSEPTVDWPNPAGRNFPGYYFVTGLISNVVPAQYAGYAMRFVAAAIASLMLAWAVTAARAMPRPGAAMLGIALGVPPMSVYLGGAVNPNSLEIFGMLAMATSTMAYLRWSGTPIGIVMIRRAMLAASIVAVCRLLSPVWIVIWFIAFLVLASKDQVIGLFRRPTLWWTALAFASCSVAAAWFPLSGVAKSEDIPLWQHSSDLRWYLSQQFIDDTLWRQMVGVFNWGDTPLTDGAFNFWTIATLVALGAVLSQIRPLGALLAASLAVAAYLLSVGLHASEYNNAGPIWQGRYSTPVFLLVPVVACFLLAAKRVRRNSEMRSQVWLPVVIVAVLAYVHVNAFGRNLRRNVSGLTPRSSAFDGPWQPPIPAGWLFAGYCVCITLIGAWIIGWLIRDQGARLADLVSAPETATDRQRRPAGRASASDVGYSNRTSDESARGSNDGVEPPSSS